MTVKSGVGLGAVVLGGGTFIGTLFGVLGSVSWIFDLVGNFRVQFLWLGALALVGLAWNRYWVPGALVLIAALVNLVAVGPYWWGSVADPLTADRLSITHLNTQAGNPDKRDVVEFIDDADADIVFLAEVTPPLLDLIDAADLTYQAVTGTPSVTPIGLLALSRDPSISGRVANLGESGVPVLILEATIGDTLVEILAFHTSSPGRLSSARDDQLGGAGERVSERDTPMILVGDFNATPWTGAFRELLNIGLVDAQRGRGIGGSWPAGWGPFKIPIDHVLHTPELTSTSFAFGSSAGSDHRSLAVTLALADAGH